MSWLNCGVTSQTAWPEEKIEIKYGNNIFVLMPLTKEYSASIHIELKNSSPEQGMTLVNRFLSALSWKCDAPAINHYGLSGSMMPIPTPKHKIPFGYSPVQFFPREIFEITNEKAKLAIALYREGLSLDNIPFQFLSFFKILNIFWKDRTINNKNELKDGLKQELENIKDENCLKRIEEIKKQKINVVDYLYTTCRCAIAHAFSIPIVDPDNVDDLYRISEDIVIIKTIAIHLIEREFKIEQSVLNKACWMV